MVARRSKPPISADTAGIPYPDQRWQGSAPDEAEFIRAGVRPAFLPYEIVGLSTIVRSTEPTAGVFGAFAPATCVPVGGLARRRLECGRGYKPQTSQGHSRSSYRDGGSTPPRCISSPAMRRRSSVVVRRAATALSLRFTGRGDCPPESGSGAVMPEGLIRARVSLFSIAPGSGWRGVNAALAVFRFSRPRTACAGSRNSIDLAPPNYATRIKDASRCVAPNCLRGGRRRGAGGVYDRVARIRGALLLESAQRQQRAGSSPAPGVCSVSAAWERQWFVPHVCDGTVAASNSASVTERRVLGCRVGNPARRGAFNNLRGAA